MRNGIVRFLLGFSYRRRSPAQSIRSRTRGRRPSVESLETRALPSTLLIATLGSIDLAEHPVVNLANGVVSVTDPLNSVGQQSPGDAGGQSGGSQGNSTGNASTHLQIVGGSQPETPIDWVDLQPIPNGNQNGNAQGNNGQQSGPADQGEGEGGPQGSQGEGQNGPGDNSDRSQSDSGQPNDPSDVQSDQGGSQEDGQEGSQGDAPTGQSDGGTNGLLGGHCHGTSTATGTDGQDAQSSSSLSDSQDGNQDDGGQDNDVNNGSVSPPNGKTNSSTLDPIGDNTNNGSAVSTGQGITTAGNNQNNAAEKKQTSPSSGSFLEGEQHGPGSVLDGKQHVQDAPVVPSDELRSLVSAGVQEPEARTRSLTGLQAQQQNPTLESPGARPFQERMPPPETFSRPTVAESPSASAEEVVARLIDDLPEEAGQGRGYPDVPPQSGGLLTNSLSLDFSSLRADVQSFFEQIENLGAHATDRQISVVLCSGAVVVAAAMACEVARRQARQPAPGSTLTLVPKRDAGTEPGVTPAVGLLHVGQFFTFS